MQQRLKDHDRDYGYLVDKGQRFHGMVLIDSLTAQLKTSEPKLSNAYLSDVPQLYAEVPLSETIGVVANSLCGVPVVDDQRRYLGAITKAGLLRPHPPRWRRSGWPLPLRAP